MPKMSFVIPVWNSQDYLKKCIDSIIVQSETDIEIICVNDGSSDNSLEILREFAAKDSRVRIINQKNFGAGASRNVGITASNGEYIAFVDSDDYIEKDFAKLSYACAVKHRAQCVHINNIEYYPNGEISQIDTLEEYKKRGASGNLEYNKFINYKEFHNSLMIYDQAPWRRIYARNFLISSNIFFPETVKPMGEDFSFSLACKINTDVFFMDAVLYHHKNRTDSISHNPNNKVPIREIIEACNIVKQNFSKNNVVEFNEAFDIGIVNYCMWANYLNRNDEDYISKIKPHLTETQYLKFLKETIRIDLMHELKSEIKKDLVQTIFSVKNQMSNYKKYKVITIFGIKIKIKTAESCMVVRERERERVIPLIDYKYKKVA